MTIKELASYALENFEAVVVEGYDGVGKGRVLNQLSQELGTKPYRPDYNLWNQFDLRQSDRWKISGFFWDILSQVDLYNDDKVMLFDRGVISGAVYNDDMRIAEHYLEIIRDRRLLHVLVMCSDEDYIKFMKARNPEIGDDISQDTLDIYHNYCMKYIEALEISNVEYLIYYNKYDESIDHTLCESCGHFNYGYCRHPEIDHEVNPKNNRCSKSKDKEVQDIGTEMCSM